MFSIPLHKSVSQPTAGSLELTNDGVRWSWNTETTAETAQQCSARIQNTELKPLQQCRYADGGVLESCAGLNCPQQGSTSDQTNVPEITLPPLPRAQSGLRTAFNICQIVDIAYLFWQSRILRQDVTSALLPFQLIFSHNFWIVRRSALQKQHICWILLCNLKF